MTLIAGDRSRRSPEGATLATPSEKDSDIHEGKSRPKSEASVRRAAEGALRAMARRNQLLPWSWDHLTPIDLTEIRFLLWGLPSNASQIEDEAAFAIAAILTTGRKLSYLLELSVFDTEDEMRRASVSEGLIRNGESPFWCFVAGSPGRQEGRRERQRGRRRYKDERPTYFQLSLEPVAKVCFSRLLVSIPERNSLLFWSGEKALRSTIQLMLKGRREGPVAPRRSSNTVECLERYLTVAITHQSRGDIGAAARFTDSDEVMSRSVMHYGVTHLRSTLWRSREATLSINGRRHSGFLSGCPNQIGSDRAPSWNQVEQLILCISQLLRTGQATVEERHMAMTYYTVALLCFSLGHRGLGYSLPGPAAVDPITSFCKIHEKSKKDPRESRMVWVAPAALKQMDAYKDHLLSLRAELDDEATEEIKRRISDGCLPLFTFEDRKVTPLSIKRVWKSLNQQLPQLSTSFYFHENSGRHWLRSELEGMCASETLHAFFGHSQSGTDPWSLGSCFDPLLYRADLETRLGGVLHRAGWRALKASGEFA